LLDRRIAWHISGDRCTTKSQIGQKLPTLAAIPGLRFKILLVWLSLLLLRSSCKKTINPSSLNTPENSNSKRAVLGPVIHLHPNPLNTMLRSLHVLWHPKEQGVRLLELMFSDSTFMFCQHLFWQIPPAAQSGSQGSKRLFTRTGPSSLSSCIVSFFHHFFFRH
jgi:hypothetical protein